jgi:hypothetical protein
VNADLVPVSFGHNGGPLAVEYDHDSESGVDICPNCMTTPLQLLKLLSQGFRNKLEAISTEAVRLREEANRAAVERLLHDPTWEKEAGH